MEKNRLTLLLEEGKISFNKSDFKSALVAFQECIEIDPFNVDAYFFLANIFHLQGEIGKAIKAFKKVLEIDPEHTEAAISLSVVLNDIGKYDEAKSIFEGLKVSSTSLDHGIKDGHINKKFSQRHMELGDMYAVYQRYDEALNEFTKSLQLDSANFDVRIKISKIYAKKGLHNRALEELSRLKMENPTYVPARIALGLLHYSNGNIVAAQSEWQSVLSRDPSNYQAKMYLNISREADTTTLDVF